MTRKKIKPWITLKFDVIPNLMVCDRCGSTRELHLPAAIDNVTRQMEAFSESHKSCKETTCHQT